jgi:hypothetical protein
MLKIAHIINPVAVDIGSRFHFVQRVTYHTMQVARDYSAADVDVELISVQYPEDHAMIPVGFVRTSDLERSVLDCGDFHIPRKLPLLSDILFTAWENIGADYFVYTNVDIGVMPYFYQAIATYIRKGIEAFVINRRTISERYRNLEEVPLMYADLGKPHRGWDCFVFPREWVPTFNLGTICIGAPLIGLALLSNMLILATDYKEFRNKHLTFHLGDDKIWNQKLFSDYRDHNYVQLLEQLENLTDIYSGFPDASAPARFLAWQSNSLKSALYRFYTRHPLPLNIARLLKNGS